MKKQTLAVGAISFALGAALFGGGAAYAAGIMAERSTSPVYVDGQRVELEAYLIHGNNYIKLRDVGQAVGFNVYWNGAVQIQSDAPYTGEAPAIIPAAIPVPQEQTTPATSAAPDASAETNPAIFTGNYTREAYNAIRQTVATGADSALVAMSDGTWDAMQEVTGAIGNWPAYHLKAKDGKAYFTAKQPDSYQAAASYCKPFVDSLAGKDEADKVREIAFYVCDRLTYDATAFSTPRTVLTSDAVSGGNCMAYAHNFMFLCNMADVPCVLVHSGTHQWNEVYVSGRWWYVDVSATDAGNELSIRPYQTILWEQSDAQGADYQLENPALATFAKEILVPGSTK